MSPTSLFSGKGSTCQTFYIIIPKLLLKPLEFLIIYLYIYIFVSLFTCVFYHGPRRQVRGPAWAIKHHSSMFAVPVTTPQFVQTRLELLPVQRHKQELIAVTNVFPSSPSGSFSCEVSSNKHVTREAKMTHTRFINVSCVILDHTIEDVQHLHTERILWLCSITHKMKVWWEV